ncbi:hypothetical protein LH128_14027 [Sphingomonas sp. LH128]|uniref:hypothetical protein n=1 Tax=Sphingomonas sp. LH128 TaxID=473781 RepID=UPI00027C9763|nr:hypothetical protein [Sphingomonas sp. LH128]EJU12393.1 hypothetical protein LH128_14027 [Sphingomonas sp. LH128]
MKFFESRNGNLYPISSIERIIPSSEPTSVGHLRYARAFLKGDGGAPVEIYDTQIEAIKRAGQAFVPAQDGFFVLGYYHSDDLENLEPWIDRTPILAWRMGEYGPDPVTLDEMYNEDLRTHHAILRPDGKVMSPALQTDYDDLEKWEAAMTEQAQTKILQRGAEGGSAE